jgi:predicted  nucleic acid-binding Zn-ribbon protein
VFIQFDKLSSFNLVDPKLRSLEVVRHFAVLEDDHHISSDQQENNRLRGKLRQSTQDLDDFRRRLLDTENQLKGECSSKDTVISILQNVGTKKRKSLNQISELVQGSTRTI